MYNNNIENHESSLLEGYEYEMEKKVPTTGLLGEAQGYCWFKEFSIFLVTLTFPEHGESGETKKKHLNTFSSVVHVEKMEMLKTESAYYFYP